MGNRNMHAASLRTRQRNMTGFTIVELMFSMVFIAFILMFIVFDTIHLSRLYTKGVTTKMISQSGRSVVESMSRDIEASTMVDIVGSGSSVGMLCTDTVVYAWNGIDAPPLPSDRNSYQSVPTESISLVRINDPSKCQRSNISPLVAGRSQSLPFPYAVGNQTNISTELLPKQIAVVDMSLVPIANTNGKLYTLEVTIGSSSLDVYTFDGSDRVCSYEPIGDYCSVSKISTIVYLSRR